MEHEASDVAPTAAEYLPVTQSVHVSRPAALLYFPARQLTHASPLGPEYPCLHTQPALPAILSESAGHGVQASDPEAPLYVFSGQVVQEPDGPVNPGGQFDWQSVTSSLPAADIWP